MKPGRSCTPVRGVAESPSTHLRCHEPCIKKLIKEWRVNECGPDTSIRDLDATNAFPVLGFAVLIDGY